MTNSLFFKPVSLAFAIITLVVSLIWSILSFLTILCYNDLFGNDHTHLSFGLRNFTNNLYDLYLSGENSSNRVVPPNVFYVLMWIYFLITLFLLFSSGVQIVVLTKKTKPRKFNFSTVVWLFLNYTVCIFDFITCILFGVDFYYIRQEYYDDSPTSEVILAVPITLIILSAKGFVLWILNITITIMITVLFTRKTSAEPISKYDPQLYANNNAAYDAYGDHTIPEDNRKRSTGTDSQWTEKSNSSDNSSHESENSIYNANTDGILTTTSTWSRTPRVHTDSYVRPRSLVASLNPSPIPPPTLEEPARQHESISIYNSYRSINDYDYVDPHAEIVEMKDPSYLEAAYPTTGRFTTKNPQAEIAEMNDPSYLEAAYPTTGRFTTKNPQAEIAEMNDPLYLKSAYPITGRFTTENPQAEIAEMNDPLYLKSAYPTTGRFKMEDPQAEIAELKDPMYLQSAFSKPSKFKTEEPEPDYY